MDEKILSLIVAFTVVCLALNVSAVPLLNSSYTTTPPTIDGTLSQGEWTNGMNITLNGFTTPANTIAGELYVLNNDTTLFIALVISDSTQDTGQDWAMVDFDQGHDHTATYGGEDSADIGYYNATRGYSDNYWGTDPLDYTWWTTDTGGGGTSHGSGAVGYVSSQYTYEIQKPLNSSEAKDIALARGDVVGFRIEIWEQTANDNYRYPQNTVDANTSRWNEWADLTIATSSTTTSTTTTTTTTTTTSTTSTTTSTSSTTTTTTTTSTTTTTIPTIAYNTTANFTAGQPQSINATGTNVSMTIITSNNLSNVAINVTSYSGNPTNASFSVSGLGRYINIEASPVLTNNLTYVILSVGYTEQEITGMNESTLGLYWYNSTVSEWQRLNTSTPWMNSWVYGTGVNTNSDFVWANVSHFSIYTIGGTSLASTFNTVLQQGWNLISLPLIV